MCLVEISPQNLLIRSTPSERIACSQTSNFRSAFFDFFTQSIAIQAKRFAPGAQKFETVQVLVKDDFKAYLFAIFYFFRG